MTTSRTNLAAATPPVMAPPFSAQTVPPATAAQEAKLIAVLESDASQKDKVDACRQLAVIGTARAVPALAGLLGDEKLSHMARYALEPIPDRAVDDVLLEAAGKLGGRPLVGVIGSLGVRADPRAVEPLARLLGGSDATAARAAARALGKIHTPAARKALAGSLASAGPALRPVVADGCLAHAEALIAAGQRDEAAALFGAVARADLPAHVKLAAALSAAESGKPPKKE